MTFLLQSVTSKKLLYKSSAFLSILSPYHPIAKQTRSLTLRYFSMTTNNESELKPFPKPAARFAKKSKDVWSLINETAAAVEKEKGEKVVNLGQGFFSYSPPDFAIAAAKKALDNPMLNQYAPTRGLLSLRKALADSYSPFFDRQLNPETEIVVTAGANEGMYCAFTAFLEPGDEVIVFEPFFDQYIPNIQFPGGVVRYVPLHPPKDGDFKTTNASEWAVDFEELEKTFNEKTKIIVLNTPQNPTGKVFSREELERIGALAVKHNVIIISDEVYDRLYYGEFNRIANLSPALSRLTLTVGSAGKTFSATGWRVGWLIGHKELIDQVAYVHTRVTFTVNTPLSQATADALVQAQTNGYYEKQIKDFKRKYAIFTKVFDEIGLPYTVAQGGYFLLVNFAKVQVPEDYVFPPEVTEGRARDFSLAYWLIKEIGVVAIPPTEFYTKENAHLAENYLRFAVCKNDDMLEAAVERLRGLKKYIK